MCFKCRQRAQEHAERLAWELPKGLEEWRGFKAAPRNVRRLRMTKHADLRQDQRRFSDAEIVHGVWNGHVVDREQEGNEVNLLISCDLPQGRKLHVWVVFSAAFPLEWNVRTVYDPTEECPEKGRGPHEWDGDRRVCWCRRRQPAAQA